jgi:hypothetical protein
LSDFARRRILGSSYIFGRIFYLCSSHNLINEDNYLVLSQQHTSNPIGAGLVPRLGF